MLRQGVISSKMYNSATSAVLPRLAEPAQGHVEPIYLYAIL